MWQKDDEMTPLAEYLCKVAKLDPATVPPWVRPKICEAKMEVPPWKHPDAEEELVGWPAGTDWYKPGDMMANEGGILPFAGMLDFWTIGPLDGWDSPSYNSFGTLPPFLVKRLDGSTLCDSKDATPERQFFAFTFALTREQFERAKAIQEEEKHTPTSRAPNKPLPIPEGIKKWLDGRRREDFPSVPDCWKQAMHEAVGMEWKPPEHLVDWPASLAHFLGNPKPTEA